MVFRRERYIRRFIFLKRAYNETAPSPRGPIIESVLVSRPSSAATSIRRRVNPLLSWDGNDAERSEPNAEISPELGSRGFYDAGNALPRGV